MTVADNTSRNQYTATSGQTVFAYTFEIVDKDHIVVLKNGTALSEGTDYTVSNVGNDNGGNVTLTVGATTGDILTLYRDMPYSRTQNYTTSGDFLASEVNSDFDELWLAGEQTDRAFSQSIRKPITDSDSISMELPEAATRANKFVKFDATGAVDVASATVTATADSVTISDAGNYYTSDNVEGALQEVGADLTANTAKLNTIETGADVTDTANVTAAGALMDSEVTNLDQVKAFDETDYATAAQGTTADAALPRSGGAMTGPITTNSTFDGRDVATDGAKLDGIEAGADVTDTLNVTTAGAVMDSELTNEAAVKALNQGVATTDSPTFAGATLGAVTYTSTDGTDGQVLMTNGAGVAAFEDMPSSTYLDVKDFGATGDGTTDDTTAIQNAINYASNREIQTIFFPEGHYKYTTLRLYHDATDNPDFQGSSASHTGDGIEDDFSYDWFIEKDSNLIVKVDDVTQELTTDYTVSGVGSNAGGTVTFTTAPANGASISFTVANRDGRFVFLGTGRLAIADIARVEATPQRIYGSVLESTSAGDGIIVEPVGVFTAASGGTDARAFRGENMTFFADNDGYIITSQSCPAMSFSNCAFKQFNPQGSGVRARNNWFFSMDECFIHGPSAETTITVASANSPQSDFVYDFERVTQKSEIEVYLRPSGGTEELVDPADYSINTATKTITLTSAATTGDRVRMRIASHGTGVSGATGFFAGLWNIKAGLIDSFKYGVRWDEGQFVNVSIRDTAIQNCSEHLFYAEEGTLQQVLLDNVYTENVKTQGVSTIKSGRAQYFTATNSQTVFTYDFTNPAVNYNRTVNSTEASNNFVHFKVTNYWGTNEYDVYKNWALINPANYVVTNEGDDSQSFTATSGQTVFTYTFTSPPVSSYIVITKEGVTLDSDDYTVDLNAKTVTLNAGATAGDTVVISTVKYQKVAFSSGLNVNEYVRVRAFRDNEFVVRQNGAILASSAYAIDLINKTVTLVTGATTDDVIKVSEDKAPIRTLTMTNCFNYGVKLSQPIIDINSINTFNNEGAYVFRPKQTYINIDKATNFQKSIGEFKNSNIFNDEDISGLDLPLYILTGVIPNPHNVVYSGYTTGFYDDTQDIQLFNTSENYPIAYTGYQGDTGFSKFSFGDTKVITIPPSGTGSGAYEIGSSDSRTYYDITHSTTFGQAVHLRDIGASSEVNDGRVIFIKNNESSGVGDFKYLAVYNLSESPGNNPAVILERLAPGQTGIFVFDGKNTKKWKYMGRTFNHDVELFDNQKISIGRGSQDQETFTPATPETQFTYTFDSPNTEAEISVERKLSGGSFVKTFDFTVNLSTKLVTLDTATASGEEVKISKSVGDLEIYHDSASGESRIDTLAGLTLDGLTYPTADGTSGQSIITDGSGNLTFGTVAGTGITAVVEDTTPQLGGDLDLNGNDITGTGNLDFTGTINTVLSVDGTTEDVFITGATPGLEFVESDNSGSRMRMAWATSGSFEPTLYQSLYGDSTTTYGGINIQTRASDGSGNQVVYTYDPINDRNWWGTRAAGDVRMQLQSNGDFNVRGGDVIFENSAATSDDFFWDASTSRLGLGATLPKARLQSSGAGTANAPALGSVSSNAPLYLTNSDTAYGLVAGTNTFDGHAWLQAQRTDGTATAYNLTLNEAGGNVGIGTAGATSKLFVYDSTTSKGITSQTDVDASPTTIDHEEFFTFAAITADANLTFSGGDPRLMTGAVTPDNTVVWRAANVGLVSTDSIKFYTLSSAERMRITSDGTVAIGDTTTDSVANRLKVKASGADDRIAMSTHDSTGRAQIEAQVQNYWSGATYTGTAIGQYGSTATGTTAGLSNANLGTLSFQNTSAALIYTNGNTPIHFATATTNRMTLDASGNLLVGGNLTPASSQGNLALFNGVVPTGSVTDGIVLYAEDVSSSSELKVRDEAGNITTLSPHNFDLIPEGPSEDMAWAYFSEKDGKRINVDMLKAIRLLERISGEKLVFEN